MHMTMYVYRETSTEESNLWLLVSYRIDSFLANTICIQIVAQTVTTIALNDKHVVVETPSFKFVSESL